jgi:hypothetical protein
VTALVPSDTACLASSPGKINLTAVWISREVMVDFFEYLPLPWPHEVAVAVVVAVFVFSK